MRTFSPCWKVLIVCTGVAKSTTSSRRRRLSGREVFRNSTMMFWPCCRMSMPVEVSARSTTTRPSPARPRRKSMSRTVCFASARPSAKCATGPAAEAAVVAAGSSVTSSVLPSSFASCATLRARFSTRRVRSAPCTTFMLRNSPWPISCELRPSPFAVAAKSKAIRAGLAIAKFGGTLFSGSLVVTRTTTAPPCCATSNPTMLFACAEATPMPARQMTSACNAVTRPLNMFISSPPAIAARWCVPPSRPRCPGSAP